MLSPLLAERDRAEEKKGFILVFTSAKEVSRQKGTFGAFSLNVLSRMQ